MGTLSGTILTPDGWIDGSLAFDQKIQAIRRRRPAHGVSGPRIVPGFIDLHVHGGGGADSMAGPLEVRTLARFHARHGTTSLLPTTMTAPDRSLAAAAEAVGGVQQAQGPDEARILGLHLEGPFISRRRLGAQPDFARPPDLALFDRLHALVPIRVVTFAPEIDQGHRFLRHLVGLGVRAQIGHSDATYEEASLALDAGAAGFTHLFNAMSPLHQRAPGVVGAALAKGLFAELILDLDHVAPGAVQAALRAIPNAYGVTDAMAAAGMADGVYRLGQQDVVKAGNRVTMADGTLAGSALTMDQALRNLLMLGLPLEDAVRRLSTLPADYLGLEDCGRLAEGFRADIVVLNADHAIQQVFIDGIEIDTAG
jgi:N-acetylglucosamine-6-phosphate deacetylase